MPMPLNLPVLIPVTKAMLKNAVDIVVKTGVLHRLQSDTYYLVLYGCINHVTGTTSDLEVFNDESEAVENQVFRTTIASATANGQFPLFHTSAGYACAQPFALFVVKDTDVIKFTGGTGASATLRVIKL